MNPKISFCVPVYNVEKYIEQCARTLFEQTLDDIEIIFVDDCTPDNSIKIVEELLKSYPNRAGQVKIVRHEVNKGLPAARKSAAMAATGEYICCVDSDDYVALDMAERLYQYAADHSVDIVVFDFNIVEKEVRRVDPFWGKAGDNTLDSEWVRQHTMDRLWTAPMVWCRCFKRELFLQPFVWPPCYMTEDVTLSLTLTALAGKLAYLNEPFYYYRLLENTGSRTVGFSQDFNRFNQACLNFDALQSNLKQFGIADNYQRGLVVTQMCAKNYLLPYTNKLKYRRLWFKTYPETTSLMFWGNAQFHSCWREKLWVMAIFLGLFPMLKRVLLNRRFRPDCIWWGDLFR